MSNEVIKKIMENYRQMETSIVQQLFIEFPHHHPTTGSYREDVWYSLFRQIVPYKFSIAKGAFIIDSSGEISKEVDLVIFDEQYTPYIFNYGNVRFIPIEAVAVVIQCKSNKTQTDILKDWGDSVGKLKTDTRSVTRIYTGVVDGYLDKTPSAKSKKEKACSQTATRPIKILCYLQKKHKSVNPSLNFFDFIICANEEDKKLKITIPSGGNLKDWYQMLNHNEKDLERYVNKCETDIPDRDLDEYAIGDNSILTLIFQLNQLLMLLNNPMLFPHIAYAEMFNRMA